MYRFAIPDLYFWTQTPNLPSDHGLPYRLSGQWYLDIPKAGTYILGASSSEYVRIKLDGKTILDFLQTSQDQNDLARDGVMGSPRMLKKGFHRLEWEQVRISSTGNYNQLLRLVWKMPGGTAETLPLKYLYPELPGSLNRK